MDFNPYLAAVFWVTTTASLSSAADLSMTVNVDGTAALSSE
jgi:hypothetical protein